MQNQKLWTYLGIALALGVGIQALKGPLFGHPHIAGFGQVAGLLDEGQAVYVPGAAADASPIEHKQVAVPRVHIVAPHMSPLAQPSPTPAAKKEDPKKKAEEAKKKAEADKKKKQAFDLKKKKAQAKRKKKEDIARRQAAADALKASEDKKKGSSDSSGDSGLGASGGAIGGAAPAAAGATSALPQTAADWEAYLMNVVSVDHLETFIKSYQTGQVTADIFYEVIAAMLADGRIEVQTQAVSALGASVSTPSFAALVGIDKNSSYPTKILTMARAFERQYQRLENLHYLTSDLADTSAVNQPAAYIAITMISTAAQNYLAGSVSSSTTATSTTTATATTAAATAATTAKAKAAKYFVPVLAGLKNAQTWPDVNVAQSATTTYKQISALMPVTTTATTTTAAATGTTSGTATTTP